MRSRVELFEQIRRDRRLDEPSIRELADRHGVHRRTVRQALADASITGWSIMPFSTPHNCRSAEVRSARL